MPVPKWLLSDVAFADLTFDYLTIDPKIDWTVLIGETDSDHCKNNF